MSSFKLDNDTNVKDQFKQGGILVLALSIPVTFIFSLVFGTVLFFVGLFMLLAGLGASE